MKLDEIGNVVFIGAGNVATRLALALREKGIQVAQVYSRSTNSAAHLASLVDCSWITDMKRITSDTGGYIISVPDNAIPEIVSSIPTTEKLVVHTSGTVPMSLLQQRFSNCGVLYPLQTLSKDRVIPFESVPLIIEANSPDNLHRIRALAEKLSRNITVADSENRMKLHISAVFSANFVNHLYALSFDFLKANDLSFNLLMPLIDEVTSKIKEMNPASTQTGPALRKDIVTIDKHLRELSNHTQLASIYSLLTESIINYHYHPTKFSFCF